MRVACAACSSASSASRLACSSLRRRKVGDQIVDERVLPRLGGLGGARQRVAAAGAAAGGAHGGDAAGGAPRPSGERPAAHRRRGEHRRGGGGQRARAGAPRDGAPGPRGGVRRGARPRRARDRAAPAAPERAGRGARGAPPRAACSPCRSPHSARSRRTAAHRSSSAAFCARSRSVASLSRACVARSGCRSTGENARGETGPGRERAESVARCVRRASATRSRHAAARRRPWAGCTAAARPAELRLLRASDSEARSDRLGELQRLARRRLARRGGRAAARSVASPPRARAAAPRSGRSASGRPRRSARGPRARIRAPSLNCAACSPIARLFAALRPIASVARQARLAYIGELKP